MAMLQVIQRFCSRTGITSPSTVIGATDKQVLQVLALLEEEGADLSGRGDWEALTFEATHTALAAEDQGAIATIASNGFRNFKQGTFWNRSLKRPISVVDDQNWQSEKALVGTGSFTSARIRGGKLLTIPNPTAGNTLAFEYLSWNWILAADNVTYKQYFTLDTDTMLLPEAILVQGLRWRWKKEKGFEYAEDFRMYEIMVSKALGSNGLKNSLNMGDQPQSKHPGIGVANSNWSIP